MTKPSDYVVHICTGTFLSDEGKKLEYYKALVRTVKGDSVSYALVKASPEWAQSFSDFNTCVVLYFDRYGRVTGHQVV